MYSSDNIPLSILILGRIIKFALQRSVMVLPFNHCSKSTYRELEFAVNRFLFMTTIKYFYYRLSCNIIWHTPANYKYYILMNKKSKSSGSCSRSWRSCLFIYIPSKVIQDQQLKFNYIFTSSHLFITHPIMQRAHK